MEDHNVTIRQLLVAHEQGIRALRLEIEMLRSEVKRLRADLLASLKYTRSTEERNYGATDCETKRLLVFPFINSNFHS